MAMESIISIYMLGKGISSTRQDSFFHIHLWIQSRKGQRRSFQRCQPDSTADHDNGGVLLSSETAEHQETDVRFQIMPKPRKENDRPFHQAILRCGFTLRA